MCVPACQEKIARTISRRGFLKGAGMATAAGVLTGCTGVVAPAAPVAPVTTASATTLTFERIVDLTHTMDANFPTFSGDPGVEVTTIFTLENDGFNLNHWLLNEHTGTHMDAPFHFSSEQTADMIPVENLMGPLAVIDVRAGAEEDPDYLLSPDDVSAWEAENGELPPGAIVAMMSGWDAFVGDDKFRNADDEGVMHFPGFHIETIDLLLNERDVKGIMVDTLSLDHGPSADFAVHYAWLPANRWGIENVANLGELPATGATVIVGGPKIAGATGGPSRVIALV